MRVVTGGRGRVGSFTVREPAAAGHEVVDLDGERPPADLPRVEPSSATAEAAWHRDGHRVGAMTDPATPGAPDLAALHAQLARVTEQLEAVAAEQPVELEVWEAREAFAAPPDGFPRPPMPAA